MAWFIGMSIVIVVVVLLAMRIRLDFEERERMRVSRRRHVSKDKTLAGEFVDGSSGSDCVTGEGPDLSFTGRAH